MQKELLRRFEAYDIITIAYAIISGIFILIGSFKLENFQTRILIRIAFIAIIVVIAIFLYDKKNTFLRIIRNFYILPVVIYFFSEGDYINNIFFPDLDKYMANFELTIFSVLPGVSLSNLLHYKWFAEIFSIIYLSFFVIFGYFIIRIYRKHQEQFGYIVFLLSMTFYMIFLIFLFCPVAGPQYYLVPPDNQIPEGGFIRNATYWMLIHFDIPASCFPSISALMLCFMIYLGYQNMKSLVKYLIPLTILILLSTVYLKIHYAIDVIAGLLSFPALFWLSSRTYDWINNFLDGNVHSLSDFFYSIPKVYGKH